jgi:hypothetical protein
MSMTAELIQRAQACNARTVRRDATAPTENDPPTSGLTFEAFCRLTDTTWEGFQAALDNLDAKTE